MQADPVVAVLAVPPGRGDEPHELDGASGSTGVRRRRWREPRRDRARHPTAQAGPRTGHRCDRHVDPSDGVRPWRAGHRRWYRRLVERYLAVPRHLIGAAAPTGDSANQAIAQLAHRELIRDCGSRSKEICCIARSCIYRLSPVERSIGLAFTTLTIFAPLAHAAHPQQAIQPEGTASPLQFVATSRPLAGAAGLAAVAGVTSRSKGAHAS